VEKSYKYAFRKKGGVGEREGQVCEMDGTLRVRQIQSTQKTSRENRGLSQKRRQKKGREKTKKHAEKESRGKSSSRREIGRGGKK